MSNSNAGINPDDLRVEIVRNQIYSLDVYPGDNETIQITHIPIGLVSVASHRSQLQAKAIALAELQDKLDKATSNQ